jgi:hypothetical protein
LSAHFVTSVAFDAATLTIALGTAPGGAQVLAAQNVKAAGRIDLPISIAAVGPFLADTPIYWTAALTGGPDTVGACAFWLEYLPGPG